MNKFLTLMTASILCCSVFGYAGDPPPAKTTPTPAPAKGAPPVVIAPASGPINVSAGQAAQQLLTKVAAEYPAIAKASRIQGTVVMNVQVDTTGAVQDITIVSGPPMLQQSAMVAVRQYKYRPFQLNGKAVAAKFPVNVVYSLSN